MPQLPPTGIQSWRRFMPRLPVLEWGRHYQVSTLGADTFAAVIVTIMLIPQSMAYAMLAGLPAEVGLYASIAPLVVYALLGTSRTLAIGPVAVASLMTAAAIGQVAKVGTPEYWHAAILLAFLSGLMLVILGLFRVGYLANFLSHPVISGFISASGLIIAVSQVKHLIGVEASGHNLLALMSSMFSQLGSANWVTMLLGVTATAFLFWSRFQLQPLLARMGMAASLVNALTKAGPVVAIVVTTLAVWGLGLHHHGVAIVGHIPAGLPPFTLPEWNPTLWAELASPALLIGIVGFVESVSVGQTLAAKRRQRIEPDQELVALGSSNLAASLTGGFPVTGGFSRSVVNFDAGAQTPAAGVLAAAGIALVSVTLTPALFYLPKATLAATIIVAVLSLVDLRVFSRTWRYAKSDFAGVFTTFVVTLAIGIEAGLVAGVGVSILLLLYRTSRPHVAQIGLVAGTEHFRNIDRHQVIVSERLLSLRVDESLYFANARYLEDTLNEMLVAKPNLEFVVLQCSAVSEIDASALESLEAIDRRLAAAGLTLSMSEIKGPVMDRLKRSDFLDHLSGGIFLTHYQAVMAMTPEILSNSAATQPD
ncbi:MAG: SulP family inorganic anion transporter [Burkholderiaceae bacterium]